MHQGAWQIAMVLQFIWAGVCLFLPSFTHPFTPFLQPRWLTPRNLHLSVSCLWQPPATLFTHQHPPLASKNKFLAEFTFFFSKHLTTDWKFLSLHHLVTEFAEINSVSSLSSSPPLQDATFALKPGFWLTPEVLYLSKIFLDLEKKLNGSQLCITKT